MPRGDVDLACLQLKLMAHLNHKPLQQDVSQPRSLRSVASRLLEGFQKGVKFWNRVFGGIFQSLNPF